MTIEQMIARQQELLNAARSAGRNMTREEAAEFEQLVLASPMAARVPLLLHQQATHRKARDSRHLLQAKVETVDRIHRTHREPSRQKDRESAALRTSVQSSVLMPDLTSTTDLPRSR